MGCIITMRNDSRFNCLDDYDEVDELLNKSGSYKNLRVTQKVTMSDFSVGSRKTLLKIDEIISVEDTDVSYG